MRIRLLGVSIFLILNYSLFSMETEKFDDTYDIPTLQEWQNYKNEYKDEPLDVEKISPRAVAEFHQKYEVKTDLPVLQEAIDAWSKIKGSATYKQKVLGMHIVLWNGIQTNDNTETSDLFDLFIKKSYEQLEKPHPKERELRNKKQELECKRKEYIQFKNMLGFTPSGWVSKSLATMGTLLGLYSAFMITKLA